MSESFAKTVSDLPPNSRPETLLVSSGSEVFPKEQSTLNEKKSMFRRPRSPIFGQIRLASGMLVRCADGTHCNHFAIFPAFPSHLQKLILGVPRKVVQFQWEKPGSWVSPEKWSNFNEKNRGLGVPRKWVQFQWEKSKSWVSPEKWSHFNEKNQRQQCL